MITTTWNTAKIQHCHKDLQLLKITPTVFSNYANVSNEYMPLRLRQVAGINVC